MPKARGGYWRTNTGSRGGPMVRAVEAALADLGDLGGFDLVRAQVVRDLADLADGCRARQDPARYLAAWAKLERLLAELGAPAAAAGGGDGGGVESGAGDGDADPLASVLGSGPSVGNAEES